MRSTGDMKNIGDDGGVWFVYDGECPLCLLGATHLRIKEAVGQLHLLDKRETADDHPLIREINKQKIDLDKGMIIKMGGRLYQGVDALHVMALIGSSKGWFNRFNVALFRYRPVAVLCYPFLRGARNLLLKIKGVPPIKNLENAKQ